MPEVLAAASAAVPSAHLEAEGARDDIPFVAFVKAVGRGHKLRRDLTQAEAAQAMRLMLSGAATPAQVGAFLIAQRVKGEAEAEIRGFTEAARREFVEPLRPRVADLLDLAAPYDGKVKTAQLAPAVGLVLAACGVPVLLHGAEGVPTKQGITPGAVLAELGIPADLPPAAAASRLEAVGFAFVDAARFAPAWTALLPLRRELGLRTALNTVEKLLNPADAPFQVSGFFHGEYIERLRAAHTGTRAGWMVQGEEGSVEMAAGRATRIFAAREADDVVVDAAGLLPEAVQRERLSPDFTVEAHARLNAEALLGRPGPAARQAALTAGIILWLVGAAPSAEGGLARAWHALRAGAAEQQWQKAKG